MAGGRKYLSTSEMVNGFRKKTNKPIPNLVIPGDFRVYRPTKYDVLCGRGKPIQDHTGNLRMRRIVAKYTERYMNARKHKKQDIVEEVVDLVKSSGGVLSRFLKRVGRENYWVEVPHSMACDKVSHALRCLVRKSEAGESIDIGEDTVSVASSEAESNVTPVSQEELSPEIKASSISPNSLPSVLKTGSLLHAPSLPMASLMQPNLLASQLLHHNPVAALGPLSSTTLSGRALSSSLAAKELQTRLAISQLSNSHLLEVMAKEQLLAQELVAQKQLQQLEQSKLATNDFLARALSAEQLKQQQQQQVIASQLTRALLAVPSPEDRVV